MNLTRYEFEVLCFFVKRGNGVYAVRSISDAACLSGTMVEKTIEDLKRKELLVLTEDGFVVTKKGLNSLEPYRVKRAIIFAAGFGLRMMPATKDKPKPMVEVNGTRIIDTLLNALTKAGVQEIVIVGGYKFEKLNAILKTYPGIQLIENKEYAVTNNISSAIAALDWIQGGCYICEADLYITNPGIIEKYQYASNILGAYSLETDDWSYKMKDGCVSDYQKGNTFCYNYYGISYWTAEDCEKLQKDFSDVYHSPGGTDFFWEFIPFVLKKEHYKVEIRPCRKQDIMEIDNYYELAQLDPKY